MAATIPARASSTTLALRRHAPSQAPSHAASKSIAPRGSVAPSHTPSHAPPHASKSVAPLSPPRPTRAPRPKIRVGRPSGRFTQVKRLDRLRDFLEKEPSGLEISALAAGLQITERSVRRYLKVLHATTLLESIPTTPGGPHKWRIKPVERARSITLRRTQAYAILSAQRVFETWRGSTLYEDLAVALDQIRAVGARAARGGSIGEAVLDVHLDERFFHLPPPATSLVARGDDLDALFQAVAILHPLSFRLATPNLPKGERAPRITVHPYAVIEFGGSLFIVGPEAGREESRVFAFDQTSDLRTVEKNKFFIPAEFEVSAFLHGAFGVAPPTATRALIEFESGVKEIRVKKVHPAQKLFTAKDGRARLSFPLANRDAVAAFVLSFGDAARVIEPPDFAFEVANRLFRAARRYGAAVEIPAPSLQVRTPAG